MSDKPIIFVTPQVADLLEADRFSLNRLLLRSGIETSFGSRGRGSQLIFTVEDVVKASIAYWLFRSGLRTPAIKQAIKHRRMVELCKGMTTVAEIKGLAAKHEYLITWRVAGGGLASQEVVFDRSIAGLERVMDTEDYDYGFLILPLGHLLRELALKISSFSLKG